MTESKDGNGDHPHSHRKDEGGDHLHSLRVGLAAWAAALFTGGISMIGVAATAGSLVFFGHGTISLVIGIVLIVPIALAVMAGVMTVSNYFLKQRRATQGHRQRRK